MLPNLGREKSSHLKTRRPKRSYIVRKTDERGWIPVPHFTWPNIECFLDYSVEANDTMRLGVGIKGRLLPPCILVWTLLEVRAWVYNINPNIVTLCFLYLVSWSARVTKRERNNRASNCVDAFVSSFVLYSVLFVEHNMIGPHTHFRISVSILAHTPRLWIWHVFMTFEWRCLSQ